MEITGTLEIKRMSDSALHEKIKTLSAQERKLTQVVLWHIAEIDRRKLFARKAYPSLYEYLTQEIGYSSGAAQRRIDAARLLQRIPELSEKIGAGAINLGQISKIQKICRHIKKQSGQPVPISLQKNILQKIENHGSEHTDFILAREFQIEIKTQEKKQIQKDESVRVEITFTKEEMTLLKRAQDLLSNKTGGQLKDTLLEMAQKTVKSFELKVGHRRSTATVAVTPKLKKEILQRDQVCQFTDTETGKVCGAKQYLEVDHIQPRFAYGDNTHENLRVLCKTHNIFRYEAGL